MIVYPVVEQRSPEWVALRRGRPTASRLKDIMTPVKCEYSKSATKYMASLIADCFDTDIDGMLEGEKYSNYWTSRGIDLEPLARIELGKILGVDISEVGFCLHDAGLFGCSPDGLVKENGVWSKGCEFKCPAPKTHVQWVMEGGIPSEYLCQVHGSMVITGLKQWEFLSYCPGMKPLHVTAEHNDFTERLAECMDRFAREYKETMALMMPKLQLQLEQ